MVNYLIIPSLSEILLLNPCPKSESFNSSLNDTGIQRLVSFKRVYYYDVYYNLNNPKGSTKDLKVFLMLKCHIIPSFS
jgi:hypothetical protein